MGKEVELGDKAVNDALDTGVKRYKGRDDYKDLIRIVGGIQMYELHNWKDGERWQYVNCSKEELKKCLVCDEMVDNKDIKRQAKFGAIIIHIAEKYKKGEWQTIGECKVWLFGGDKYRTLSGIKEDVLGSDTQIQDKDLIINCTDKKLQELIINPSPHDTKATKDMASNLEDAKDKLAFFTDPASIKKQKEALGIEGDAEVDDEESKKIAEEIGSKNEDGAGEKKEEDKSDDPLAGLAENGKIPF